MKKTFQVRSSHGIFIVNKADGIVKCFVQDEDGQDSSIVQFDVREWLRYHKCAPIPDSVDILDFGYWVHGYYVEPDADWRALMIDLFDPNTGQYSTHGTKFGKWLKRGHYAVLQKQYTLRGLRLYPR